MTLNFEDQARVALARTSDALTLASYAAMRGDEELEEFAKLDALLLKAQLGEALDRAGRDEDVHRPPIEVEYRPL